MTRIIALDTSVVGLLVHPHSTPESDRCRMWLAEHRAAGDLFILPEIVDYETRREMLRRQAIGGIRRLDTLHLVATYIPLTTAAMRLAAEFWARVRRQGQMTAPDAALDADAILAAQAVLFADDQEALVIATTNVKHLNLFATAQLWHDIPTAAPIGDARDAN